MDLASIGQRLESGEHLKIKYRYPIAGEVDSNQAYGVRSDKLLDVSREGNRLFAKFRGMTPVWIQVDEVLDIAPDDGVYEEFSV